MTPPRPPDEPPRETPLGTPPIRNPTLRRELVYRYDICPECGGDLDTGWECNDCGFDAQPEVREDRL